MTHAERLDRIEARLKPTPGTTMWVCFVSPKDPDRPATRIRCTDRQWQRREGEEEEAFRARAEAEAALQYANSPLMMLMD